MDEPRVELALEGTGTGTFEWDIAKDEVRWSAKLSELRGTTGSPRTFDAWVQSVHADDRERMRATALEAVRTGVGYECAFRSVAPDGQVHWSETRTHVVAGEDGLPRMLVGLVSDVTERHRREQATAFLAQAGIELARSLEVGPTLRRVAWLAVPELADRCTIVLVDGDRVETFGSVDDAEPSEISIDVARTGEPAFSEAAVVVPIMARGRTLGAMTFELTGSGRAYRAFDLDLAEELGRRAGLAIDNARLHEQARGAAELLQRSLLPEDLAAPGVEVAAAYRPGEDGTRVGGDWYDVVPLADGRCAIVAGDVVGRGLAAAATMGQVRAWLRTHAVRRDDPVDVLADLDTDIELLGGVSFATCAVAFLDPATGRATMASAGHLPALVVAAGEAGFVAGATGPPLGVPRPQRASAGFTLAPGATLVLYTDGLVERRDATIDSRLERLRAVAAQCPDDPSALVDTVLDAMLERSIHPDDAVVLAVRRR